MGFQKAKALALFVAGLMMAIVAKPQGQLPDGGFENWTMPPFSTYENPAANWWTTLNALSGLGAPVTVEKTTDAHSGTYAAKLTTQQWGTVLLPGLLVSGEFNIQNPNFLVQGQPFTDLPQAFQGWYKFSPVAGDSAALAALLIRWDNGLQRRDTLAQAVAMLHDAQSVWTAFDLPFDYLQTGVTPDSILVALVSSGDGQNFNGQVGSTLWIDDLSLLYSTPAPGPEATVPPKFRLQGRHLTVEVPAGSAADALQLHDLHGRCLTVARFQGGQLALDLPFPDGIYFARVFKGDRVLGTQKLVLMQP